MTPKLVGRIMLAQYETESVLEETIRYFGEAGFNSVMIMNCRGHCEPAHYTREQIVERAEIMRRAVTGFRTAGYSVSINNLATVGMNLSPPAKHDFEIQPLVDPDGQVFTECFCPLDPKFLEYLDFLFYTWAALGPDEIWIDDDFRYKNKAAHCFCPLHLKQLEQETGRAWQREELVEELQKVPVSASNELSSRWSNIQKNALLGAARQIATAVHRADPGIAIGLMGITNSVHHYGARYLTQLLQILNPSGVPPVRPEFTAYSDMERISWSAYWPRWACERAFGQNFIAYPEYETWPGTQFNHSYRVLRMKYKWAAMHGFRDAAESTMWETYRHEPDFPAFQKETFGIYKCLGEVMADPDLVPSGVSLELSEDRAGKNGGGDILWIDAIAANLVGRLGIPLWPGGGHATFFAGNSPLSHLERWDELLKRGIVLDRAACDALVASGHGELLGGIGSTSMAGIPAWESFVKSDLNGLAAGSIISMETATARRLDMPAFVLPDDSQIQVLSWFEDEDGNRLSAGTWTRETPQGRIVVLPYSMYDASSQNATANWKRKSQIENLLEWAAQKPLPVKIGGAADLFCVYRESKDKNRILIGLANFSNDPADHFTLTLPITATWPSYTTRLLDDAGAWTVKEILKNGSALVVQGQIIVEPQTVCVLEVTRR